VAARASAKNPALALKRCAAGDRGELASLNDGGARGSSDAGTDTKAPKSESVALIEPTRGRGLGGCENMDDDDDDPFGRGEAGGVTGAKRVAKRSSRSSLFGRGTGDRLLGGRGISGEMELSDEGMIGLSWRRYSVREGVCLCRQGGINNVDIGRSTERSTPRTF
jgi:hypothetical protein